MGVPPSGLIALAIAQHAGMVAAKDLRNHFLGGLNIHELNLKGQILAG